MLPRCEFRPLDFGVNRSLLLSWCLRAKQGHTDAQPKRSGCPSGAGVRISWWASQPCSIRLGTAEPEDLPARCVGVWSGGRRVCGTRRRICPRGASMCHPRDRRAGGSRGTAAPAEPGVPPPRARTRGTDNRHGQQTQTTDMANRHRQQARPKDRKVPPPRARTRGTDNRHGQQAQPTGTAKRIERYRPHESGQQAQITDTANRHGQTIERGRRHERGQQIRTIDTDNTRPKDGKGPPPDGAAPLCSPSDAIRSGQRWTGPSAGSWCERSQRRSRSYAGRPSGR